MRLLDPAPYLACYGKAADGDGYDDMLDDLREALEDEKDIRMSPRAAAVAYNAILFAHSMLIALGARHGDEAIDTWIEETAKEYP